MSGSTIRAAGLDRPQEEKRDEPPPLYTESGILKGHMPKFILIGLSVLVGFMLLIALGLCIAGAVQHKQPKFFLLIINLILSSVVTGLLIFWYFRGTLVPTMLWYIFLQCVFLFFQCVTTDVFVFYNGGSGATYTPFQPIMGNCSQRNETPGCPNQTNPNSSSILDHFI